MTYDGHAKVADEDFLPGASTGVYSSADRAGTSSFFEDRLLKMRENWGRTFTPQGATQEAQVFGFDLSD